MKAYEATAEIQGRPEVIWAILTDGPGYQARPTRAAPSR